ncbi:MAG: AMP-binding protein [Muribaculaceae bacterium]
MDDYDYSEYSNLLTIYKQSWIDNFSLPALTDYGSGKTLTYGEMARRIARLHLFYKQLGVKPGDKIALLGKNTTNWIIDFMGTITYGAVIVPILHDFNPTDACHIINHSDALVLFVSDSIWENLNFDDMPGLRCVVSLENRKIITERLTTPEDATLSKTPASKIIQNLTLSFNRIYKNGFRPADIDFAEQDPENVCVINYTSGTTGFSKGVMLTYRNLWGNVVFGIRSRLHYQGSRALSFLPLAHAYGCAFDMLVPLATGTHVTLLGKLPSPQLIVSAMKKVKPSLVICVPLVLEKIYRKMIVPMISSPTVRWVLAVPMLDKAIYARIRSKLVEAFGGSFEEVIIGGAPLNPEVEDFLLRIKFPFTVGYGMTECGPLISYVPWRRFEPRSSGRVLRGLMTAKIIAEDGSEQGEICVKGVNVMKGYYKNPEATEAVLDSDGWLHTGDMGTLGKPDNRTIFIRGRYKTMILSSNGQNIYPEEIEAKLNNMPYVAESLVIERNGHLVALVYPDTETAEANGVSAEALQQTMEKNRQDLNKLVAPYERVESIELVGEEFAKTPKKSIKRFLYH